MKSHNSEFHEGYINDNIIDAFLYKACRYNGPILRIYTMSAGPSFTIRCGSDTAKARLMSSLQKISWENFDEILFPVSTGNHWLLVRIQMLDGSNLLTSETSLFLNTTQLKLLQLTHFVSFLAVYDSLGADRRALARSFQDFFQSILPQAAWVIAIPTNPGIQDDSESCGAYVMFNAWCIAQYGQAYHYTLSSRKIRNCVLHELLENCTLQTGSDRNKCRVCRKAINRKKMNTQETAGKCTVCKSVVHVSCVVPEVATELAAAFKCKDLRLRY